MRLSERLQRFRHPMSLLLAVTVVPVVILGWLGWRLLREDQVLENRRLQTRLENAAEGIAAAMDRNLSELELQLSALTTVTTVQARDSASRMGSEVGEDALVVLIDQAGIEAFPTGRLLYYPLLPAPNEPDEKVFAAGEAMELRHNDPAGACAVFRELASSTDAGVRAGALLRLARSLRKTGRLEEALAAYGELSALRTATIRGIPADLLARQARCGLLGEIARVQEMNREAGTLYSDLQNGRWRLTRAVYRFHTDQARKRTGPDRELEVTQIREQERISLAESSGRKQRRLCEPARALFRARPGKRGGMELRT